MKTFLLISALFFVGCATGCVSSNKERPKISEDRQIVRDELSKEVSLKADRSNLDTLRKDVPEEKKQENDELAFYLQQTQDLKENPQRIRTHYSELVQKKRTLFHKKVEKLRTDFKKRTTADRDEFLKKQKEAREDFKGRRASPDKTKEFYADLDRARTDFYSQEQDRRKDFEEEISERTKDFNDYMKERYDAFDEQMRSYEKRWRDKQKEPRLPGADVSVPTATEPSPGE
jgi:hypothetical protein